jgi:serine phosphatase RsbU (regulator of sigma subunit)
MLPRTSHHKSQLAQAEAALQEMEAKLQQTRAVLDDRKREHRQLQAMEQKLRDTGDINKLVKFQARAFAMDKAVQELKVREVEAARQVEAARRYLYTLYVKLERLRQEAAAFTVRSHTESALLPEEQANLRRLQLQIQALTGAE